MSAKKNTEYHQITKVLEKLKEDYPTHNLGRHISMALAEYGDVWSLSDKEFLFAFEKYASELEINTVPDKDIEDLVSDANTLTDFSSFREEEAEEEDE